MFDKFGELESAEMINELAVNLLNENDIQGLKDMAKENGITEDFVEMFIGGDIPELCDVFTAAMGKLEIEKEELKLKGLMNDWYDYILVQMDGNEELARVIRTKGKSLAGCLGELLKSAFKNQVDVPKEIIKAAGISANRVTFGVPGMGEAKKIIRGYYK